jgi:dTDP-4-amino-4,6-dideoxygalactose transaminase
MNALDVKRGDEVIVPAMSWISTSETVTQAGADVVFCDIDPVTHTIDPLRLAALVTDRTVGIIPVHLYGHPADMDPIMAIADKHGLWVIEDCAQSHLATYKDRMVGSFGTAASYSFYPGKNLGAMGDAGAVVTRDKALADRMAKFARHGGLVKGQHEIEGINSRLDSLQAAVLTVKLPHLPAWTAERRRLAVDYRQALTGIDGLSVPGVADACNPAWHLFVIGHDDRDGLARYLKARGIDTVVNYPRALPFLPCYDRLQAKPEDFPTAYSLQSRCLSLPIFPEMTAVQLAHVATSLAQYVRVDV